MTDKRLIPFNINGYVRVKFSTRSLDHWKAHAVEMHKSFPKMAHLWPEMPPLDANGFYRGQFWSVMHLIADELQAGHSAFEDCMIYLEVPDA